MNATSRSKLVAAAAPDPRREVPLFAVALTVGVAVGFVAGLLAGWLTA